MSVDQEQFRSKLPPEDLKIINLIEAGGLGVEGHYAGTVMRLDVGLKDENGRIRQTLTLEKDHYTGKQRWRVFENIDSK